MQPAKPPVKSAPPWYLALGLVAIVGFALWVAQFSRVCASDGCIGVVIPGAGLFLSLAVQVLVLLPLFVWRGRKAGRPVALPALAWLGASAAGFALAILLSK